MPYGDSAPYGDNIFTARLDDQGIIWTVSAGREPKPMGVDNQKYQELLKDNADMAEVLENYRGVLIENGLLQLPKTPEELAAEFAEEQRRLMHEQLKIAQDQAKAAEAQAKEQAAINLAMLEAIKGLSATVEGMKYNGFVNGNGGPVADSVGPIQCAETGKHNGEVPGTSKGGARPRVKDPA